MKKRLYIRLLFTCVMYGCGLSANAIFLQEQDTLKSDTLVPYKPNKRPTFQPSYRFGHPFSFKSSRSPLFLRDPSKVNMQVHFNPDTTAEDAGVNYSVYENIGTLDFRPASFMTFNQFNRYNNSQLNREYFKERSAGLDGESAVSGRNLIPRIYISPVFDRIFGGSYVDIQPNGFVTLDFGGRFQRIDNPSISLRQQKSGGFNFNQQISMNVVGKIGEKLAITVNFDNNNTFDFQNNLKIEYTGYEEDIIKRIEIGNVSMPVTNSLMGGAQSLFGIKAELQFGKLYVTSVLSQQRGRSETLNIESGFQGREFEIQASEYEENKHFFIGHFFRDNYERWLATLPQITSGVNVTRLEVYVLNRNNDTETTRNIVGFMDLGEGGLIYNTEDIGNRSSGPTRNGANNLFEKLTVQTTDEVDNFIQRTFPSFENSTDFVKVTTSRKLDNSEYHINKELGYITLTRSLRSDEILAVAFEYTFNGVAYKVGELTEDYQSRGDNEVIYLKLLRPNKINTKVPTWNLMMKNIYALNASQVSKEGFQLKVIYRDDASGQDNPSLHEGRKLKDKLLIEVFGLDRLNPNGDRQPDGNFDFIDGYTINSQTGSIIFPVLQPFGMTLKDQFDQDEGSLKEKYVYDNLYTEPKATAKLNSTKNKFVITGQLTAGSSSEIALPGINIAEGSVIVTAGSTPLTEGLDYTVDYTLGRVRILNEGILSSGKTINIAYEKTDVFNFQTRTFTGTRLDYRFNDNFNIGATLFHLKERPGGVSRYAVGNEPTKNTKYGFDINYQNESRFITKMVDKIPLVSTKEPSSVTINAEVAELISGTSNVVNGEQTSYLDDFENAITPINIMGWQAWKLGSTPRGDFPDTYSISGLENRFQSAKIAWYTVDNSIFYRSASSNRPSNIDDEDLANHYERAVLPQEIFRQRDQTLVNFNEPIFDVAYFPHERGQFNYNSFFDTETSDPSARENRWGGITRAITNEVNFNETNIEYIEFWLMDPFIGVENGRVKDGLINGFANQDIDSKGELVFNLGSVSEDIAPDDRHAFENGLPINGQPIDPSVITTWGQITTDQYLVSGFENSPNAKENQDVGLDGLKDDQEAVFFPGTANDDDPSADNFRYFLDESFDSEPDATIVQRYKDWNGMDGNSQTNSGSQNFISASTILPDNEDLNQDNTISDLEEYFEYRIPLVNGLNPNGGNLVLNDFIVDQIESGNGESNWYQFRIPIKNVGIKRGSPSFENIKYIRMYLTGWSNPVVLRFAQMRLVSSQWRKYDRALNEQGLNKIPNSETSDFAISVVSIEENSTTTTGGSRYVLPPGIERDIDNTTTQNRRINEQSLQICIEDLEDKDARAVYKNVNFDLVNYGRMKMFFHAEAHKDDILSDNQLTAFIRLGTDFDENYYEIEVPLAVTPDNLNGNVASIRRQVWPLQNELDISIKELLGTKSQRNRAKFDENALYTTPSNDGRYTFVIKGRPDISAIKVLMIGVKNPGDESISSKSICLWANELRLTDFDNNSGWAANARVSVKLADLGTISAATRYSSIGFGNIQQRISERFRAETKQYDISASMNLEKFMKPDKTGLVVPMFISYEKTTITPQFDPLDPDVPLEASLETFDTNTEKERYRRIVVDRTTRRSLNFTNVRKEKVKPDSKSRIYDIENFSFSYAYNDRVSSNSSTETLLNKTVSGGINYNFSPASLIVTPFNESEKLSSPYLALIKDLNFSPVPSNLSFSTTLRRDFRLTQYYNNELTTEGVNPLYEKSFTFVRNYGLRWNFTESLNFTYNATANAIIDEPGGKVEGDINTQAEQKYIWNEILNLGRMKNFNQSMALNYTLPLNKIPFTDWLSLGTRYSVSYRWVAGAINQGANMPDSLYFGNSISNQRTIGFTGQVDMNTLYNKVTILKNANDPPAQGESKSSRDQILRFLMMLKSVSSTYTIKENTALAGFRPTAFLFGLDNGFNAPGLEFILGSQDQGIKEKAAREGWIVRNQNLNSPFKQSLGIDLNVQADVALAKDIRIQLNWNRSLNNQYQEIFRFDERSNGFETLTPSRSGNYSSSFLSIKTAFEGIDSDNSSNAFTQFERNLDVVRQRLNRENPNINIGDPNGYENLSQDVLIPSFIAAYSGKDVNKVALTPFPKTPLPNWRVDYTGLINIPGVSKVFSSFTISHGYSSTYNVSNFTNSLNYGQDVIGLQNNILDYPLAKDDNTGKLVPVYIINQVTISEQFTPLIGFNIRTKSNISTRLEFKKRRSLSLNMSNAQVVETSNNEITLDFGYSKIGFKLPWRLRGRTLTLKNNLTLRIAGSVRDSRTIQRKINGTNTITNGNFSWQIRPTITYQINNQLDFTFYMERNVTEPKGGVATFKRATTAFGVQLRFSLTQ